MCSTAEFIRRKETETCHINLAIKIATLEQEGKHGCASLLQNILNRAVMEEREKRDGEEERTR